MAAIALLALTRSAVAQTVAAARPSLPASDTIPSESPLQQRLEELEREIRALQELRKSDQAAAERAKRAPALVAGREGFALRSADGAFQLKLRGYFQTDGRFLVDNRERPFANTLLLRRMRPIIEATVWKNVDFRLMPDFGGGTTTLFDAYFDLRLSPALVLRAGKHKPPIGLERLQSATDLLFVERGLPTNLVPSRDIGLQLYGEVRGGVLSYAAGLYNGVPDLANGDADNGSNKDVAGRVFVQPFGAGGPKSLSGLGLGLAASQGIQRGTGSAPFLPTYRSPAQQAVFTYLADATAAGTTIANGDHTRISPQGYFYVGPVGVLAEYVTSSQRVNRGGNSARLDHHAWQLASSVVLTGERPSFKGVTPEHPFEPGSHGWGAFELGARYGRLTVDPDAFPLFANPAASVRRASSWGVAANWYLARGIRLQVDYDETHYRGGAADGNRRAEKAILTRIQHSF